MTFRSLFPIAAAALAAACFAIPALTQEGHSADPERGRTLAYTCYGCHGIKSYKNVYPTYSVPKLQGQQPEYLVLALQAYRSGERGHSTMHAQAASMSDEDMRDVAAFLADEPLAPTTAPVHPSALPKSAELCVACHGTDGVGVTPLYPTLSGQHADYLERALLDYQNGTRKNAVMQGFAAQLSAADIAELAAYYARQRPGLSTAEHAIWFTAHH